MRKNYFWYFLLLALAIYFIATAFFPSLHLMLNGMLVLTLVFILFGFANRNIILVFIGLGFLSIYIKDLFHFHYSTSPLFIGLFLIGLVLHYMFKPRAFNKDTENFSNHFKNEKNASYVDSERDIHLKAFFSENNTYITSQELNSLTVDTNFGEQFIDLTQAQFMTDRPLIHVDINLGETRLRVPSHWKIINKTKTPLATISFSGFPSTDDDFVTVTLTGTIVMGSLYIQY